MVPANSIIAFSIGGSSATSYGVRTSGSLRRFAEQRTPWMGFLKTMPYRFAWAETADMMSRILTWSPVSAGANAATVRQRLSSPDPGEARPISARCVVEKARIHLAVGAALPTLHRYFVSFVFLPPPSISSCKKGGRKGGNQIGPTMFMALMRVYGTYEAFFRISAPPFSPLIVSALQRYQPKKLLDKNVT